MRGINTILLVDDTFNGFSLKKKFKPVWIDELMANLNTANDSVSQQFIVISCFVNLVIFFD